MGVRKRRGMKKGRGRSRGGTRKGRGERWEKDEGPRGGGRCNEEKMGGGGAQRGGCERWDMWKT